MGSVPLPRALGSQDALSPHASLLRGVNKTSLLAALSSLHCSRDLITRSHLLAAVRFPTLAAASLNNLPRCFPLHLAVVTCVLQAPHRQHPLAAAPTPLPRLQATRRRTLSQR
jgi:hypothetical protein